MQGTRRTITDTTARLCPGDHIQAPDGKWMLVADITHTTTDGALGAHAVLLVHSALGAHGARLLILGSNTTLDIRRDFTRIPRPHLGERTKVRRAGLGYEVWDTRALEWVYLIPGTWQHDLGGAMEATEATLAHLCEAAPADDPEVPQPTTATRRSPAWKASRRTSPASTAAPTRPTRTSTTR
ncbi:hypothetical protein [Micromonospora sp. NPDC049891]|uniref:hypothetical protein n=1 Tax=Micromonospora sp. NPDC049891 TaxID=3155655 RepID=UPI0033F33EC4